MLNLDQLHIFITAFEEGSFKAAARKLKRGSSSTAEAIGLLEEHLNVSLFDRSKKFPQPTAAGLRLYDEAKTLLRHSQRFESVAESFGKGVEQTITVGCDGLVPLQLIESALIRLASAWPQIRLTVLRGNGRQLMEHCEQGKIDLILRTEKWMRESALDHFTLFNQKMAFICSPDSLLADYAKVDNEILMDTRQLCCLSMMENSILQEGRIAVDYWTFCDQEDMMRCVEQDLGWAMVPESIALDRIKMGTLKTFQPTTILTDILFGVDLWVRGDRRKGGALDQMVKLLTKSAP